MKKLLAAVTACIFAASLANAHVLEEAWKKYAGMAGQSEKPAEIETPGKIFGKAPGTGESAFDYPWKYRSRTYEMHYSNPLGLAKSIHSLALYAHDVSPDLPKEKFYRGVLGFHYSARQIAGWLNEALENHKELDASENALAGLMLSEGIIRLGKNGFEPAGSIKHVLGSAPGKKRSFARNLRHERLHVFWDEDEAFRSREQQAWRQLTDAEKADIRAKLKNYDPKNEAQLVEEWAVGRTENNGMPIK